ncbi:hypothetical protein [Nocardiopsis sp. NRRL B-16309]|uniref:hypothetical protein n=1 Tax=Nocardiopsis sp. NRRL B-16309 TaxID=1519494 RepID=UPI0006AF3CEE|nr:hypothetical protein [Nocardiopsis sp. NRRL B-16309]KOX16954.1 hypothetical protein ADL05_10100 [Nocardiopsis sp. NRRL B-16309]
MRVLASFSATDILAHAFTSPARDGAAVPDPAARFPLGEEPQRVAVASGLDRAAYTTDHDLVGVDADGTVAWRLSLDAPPASEHYMSGRSSIAFSADGSLLWLYRPDLAWHGPGRTDSLHAVDAATGEVLAGARLRSIGHGAEVRPHPDHGHVLVGVGEGQDGGATFHARLDGDALVVTPYPLTGYFQDLSPDGRMFSVSDHDEVTFHAFPSGEPVSRVGVGAFGYDEERFETLFVGQTGADFLDERTAVVAVTGEAVAPEDGGPYVQDFHENHAVDAATGRVLGPLPEPSRHAERLTVLGDGSWTGPDASGRDTRFTWSAPQPD